MIHHFVKCLLSIIGISGNVIFLVTIICSVIIIIFLLSLCSLTNLECCLNFKSNLKILVVPYLHSHWIKAT